MHLCPLDRDAPEQVDLVAERMRLTLREVVGLSCGTDLYTLGWLRARVRWHLDPRTCDGEAFLAWRDRTGSLESLEQEVLGHTLVRVEPGPDGQSFGLFATFYVHPAARRGGVASALLDAGEAWFRARGLSLCATATAATNSKLLALLEKRGYRLLHDAGEMVQWGRDLADEVTA